MTTDEHTRISAFQRIWPVIPMAAALLFFLSGLTALGDKSLWIDEMRTGYAALSRDALHMSVLRYIVLNDPVGPLYDLLIAGFCRVFGVSDVMLRLPSLVFASLSVAAFGALARRFLSEGASLVAVLLYAFSMNTLYFAQEARPYALLLFWSLLTYLIILSPPRDARRRMQVLLLVFAIGMYIHIVFAFVIANGVLYELFLANGARGDKAYHAASGATALKRIMTSPVARGAAAAALVYLPWFIILLSKSADPARTPHISAEPGKTFLAGFAGLLVGNAYAPMQIMAMTAFSALLLWGYGLVRFHTHKTGGRRIILLWTAAPVILTLTSLCLFRNVYNFFHYRYLLPIMPFLLLPMASGFAVFINQNVTGLFRRKNESWPERVADLWLRPLAMTRFVYVFMIAVFLFGNTSNRIAFGDAEHQNWRGAYRFLKQSVHPGDTVILHGIAAPAIQYYALKDPHPPAFFKTNDLSEITRRTRPMGNKWIVFYKDHWHPGFFKTSIQWLDALFQPQNSAKGVLGDITIASNHGVTLTHRQTICFTASIQKFLPRNSGAGDPIPCLLTGTAISPHPDPRQAACTAHFVMTLPQDRKIRITLPRPEYGDLSFWAQNQEKMFHLSLRNRGRRVLRLKQDVYSVGLYLDFHEQPERWRGILSNPDSFEPFCIMLEPDKPIQVPAVNREMADGKYLLNWIKK